MVRVLGPGSEREPIAGGAVTGTGPHYQFKATPFSSHTLLLAEFPRRGKGLRVLDIGFASGLDGAFSPT